jgi:hypothetical protein
VLEAHPGFKAQMDDWKNRVQAAEVQLKKERDYIRQQMEVLSTLKAGTQDYSAKEVEVAKMQSDFNVKAGLQRKQFGQDQSKIYFDAYQDIEQHVAAFAIQYQLVAVLKLNTDTPNKDRPDEVAAALSGPVMYYAKHLDITEFIIRKINDPNATARNNTGPRR